MHCMKCGTQLPQDANFCYKCGTSVGKTSSNSTKEQWEYCEVKMFKKETWWHGWWHAGFLADAVSPVKGQYTALKSRELKPKTKDDVLRTLLSEFSVQLVKDGWEPLSERGETWYSLRFKRGIQ